MQLKHQVGRGWDTLQIEVWISQGESNARQNDKVLEAIALGVEESEAFWNQ